MFRLSPIFAFGIAHLPMLGWLAAAAAPILIHLWNRQKYRDMWWAAMEYLLAALQKQTRRMRFEQWLLLAIRTLLILLLVLAVAEPYMERTGLSLPSAGRTHRVLVIDGSYSMAFQPADKSRFERARQLARQIVEAGRQGDAFSLVLMAAPPQVVVGTAAVDQGEMLDEIDNLRLPHTTADLPATVRLLGQVVRNARREDPSLVRHEVYFLTDLGRVGWNPRLAGTAAADFRQRCRRLAESAALVVIDLGQPTAENVAVTSLQALEPIVTPGRTVNLEAALKNFGTQPRTRQAVELFVDGRRVAQQHLDLRPEEEASVTLTCRFETPGDHTVELRAPGDALDVDNHRWMAVPVRRAIRVLCIDGRPSGEPFRGASDYLVVALSPDRERAPQAAVEVDVAAESALRERGLGPYDCVFLCDVAQFTSGEARVLDAYLKNGGSLVFFLGNQVLAGRYNRELGGGPGGLRLLPARLESKVARPQPGLDPLGYRHPIVAAFADREQAGLLSSPVYEYFKLSLPENSKSRVALATAGGDPLIVEEPIHRGRVVLVATSADVSWTDMPAWPSFVPVVQELLAFCVGGELRGRNVRVGQSLESSVFTPAADVPATVRRPDGRTREVRLRSDGDYGALSYGDTTTSGIYMVRFGPPLSRTQGFAVNVDTVESDLRQLGADELREEVWPGIAFDHQTKWQNPRRRPAAPIAQPGRFHVALLYGVLGLLFTETFLAWRFGYHTT